MVLRRLFTFPNPQNKSMLPFIQIPYSIVGNYFTGAENCILLRYDYWLEILTLLRLAFEFQLVKPNLAYRIRCKSPTLSDLDCQRNLVYLLGFGTRPWVGHFSTDCGSIGQCDNFTGPGWVQSTIHFGEASPRSVKDLAIRHRICAPFSIYMVLPFIWIKTRSGGWRQLEMTL